VGIWRGYLEEWLDRELLEKGRLEGQIVSAAA
jgi:hypothetical protein